MGKLDSMKLDTAIIYVQRIADGYDPVKNIPSEEDSVLNDPNVIRCMFFVKEVLEEVRKNDGVIGSSTKNRNRKEPFPYEILKDFCYQEDKSITHLLTQIHLPAEGMNIKKISPQIITGWLKRAGYLTEEFSHEVEKITTMPTEKGRQLGIYTEVRTFSARTYLAVLYDRNAQEFIVRNLEAIVDGEVIENTDEDTDEGIDR